jgi:hypothetical protein
MYDTENPNNNNSFLPITIFVGSSDNILTPSWNMFLPTTRQLKKQTSV